MTAAKEVAVLAELGWDADWESAFEPHRSEGLVPGRVAIPHRVAYDLLTADGEPRARLPGRVRRSLSPRELPVVGDWVAVDGPERAARSIRAVLPRRTAFSRRAAGDAGEQVVAANVDVVFITASLGEELDSHQLERYVTLAWQSGARPVILLTKADVVDDPAALAAESADIGGDVPVETVSTRTRQGLETVRSYLGPGVTGALLGPSGVGKSTLVNTLVGEDRLETAPVAADGSGRHTTTRRELVLLPGGGLLVDNPGMRELHLWLADEGLDDAFEDLTELAADCKFTDCRHETEPDCAVLAAIADGRLAEERLESFRALRDELESLDAELTERERSRARRGRPSAGSS